MYVYVYRWYIYTYRYVFISHLYTYIYMYAYIYTQIERWFIQPHGHSSVAVKELNEHYHSMATLNKMVSGLW